MSSHHSIHLWFFRNQEITDDPIQPDAFKEQLILGGKIASAQFDSPWFQFFRKWFISLRNLWFLEIHKFDSNRNFCVFNCDSDSAGEYAALWEI